MGLIMVVAGVLILAFQFFQIRNGAVQKEIALFIPELASGNGSPVSIATFREKSEVVFARHGILDPKEKRATLIYARIIAKRNLSPGQNELMIELLKQNQLWPAIKLSDPLQAGRWMGSESSNNRALVFSDKARASIAIGWMITTFVYTAYVASRFTGLYQILALFDMAHFGSFHPTGVFLIILFGLWIPVNWIAPKLWRGTLPRSFALSLRAGIGLASKDGSMTPISEAPRIIRRKMATWKVVLLIVSGIAATLVILGVAGFFVILKIVESTPHHAKDTVIDLSKNAPITPDAYGVKIVGEAQPEEMIVIERTFNGSSTNKAYIPYTGPGWSPGQPIRVLRKERLFPPPSTPPFGPGKSRQVPSETLTLRRDAIPGIVRAELDREHVTLAPDAVLAVGRFDD